MIKAVVFGIVGGLAVAAVADIIDLPSRGAAWWAFVVIGNYAMASLLVWASS